MKIQNCFSMNLETWKVSGVLVALSILALAIAGCGGSHETEPTPASAEPLPVEVWSVHFEEGYEIPVQFTGLVEAARESWIGFELNGTLKRVLGVEGQRVKAGEALAEMEDSRLRAALREARAGLDQATSQSELANWSLDRTREAFDLKAVSDLEWENTRSQAEVASASLEAARAKVQALEVDLEKHTIRAPFDGWIVENPLDEGAFAGPGKSVLRLVEAAPLRARIAVAVEVAGELNPGMQITLKHNRRDLDLTATVEKVSPEIQQQTHSRWVWFRLEHDVDSGDVWSGDLVEYRPKLKRSGKGCWIPVTALTESYRGLWSCYAVVPDETNEKGWRVDRRDLETLALDGERVYVRGDLLEGEQIIARGAHRVADGQAVRVVSELDEI